MVDPSCCIVLYFVNVVHIFCRVWIVDGPGDVYSGWGLTIVLYACNFTVLEACLRFPFSMFSARVFCALSVVFCMCVAHLV